MAVCVTILATILGTLAALGLSRTMLPYRAVMLGLLISPMIVPVIITAVGVYMFYSHTSPLQSGSISHAIESAALVGVVDELVHGYGLSCGHVFETSRDEAADAFGFAAVVAEGVLVEVGL